MIFTLLGVIIKVSHCDAVAHKGVIHFRRSLRCVEELLIIIQVLSYYLS